MQGLQIALTSFDIWKCVRITLVITRTLNSTEGHPGTKVVQFEIFNVEFEIFNLTWVPLDTVCVVRLSSSSEHISPM